ncbi:hypothetical protein BpHYR1_025045 [Brachionus plicatilis]|uniref:Uncharacterized protein n=1 Tax=Brachionus plicatilis TaxID=10195 RepID=A0A3M7RPR1_BRAPC|nr:hypothetical protein BpHYR1_025045 [Brachionus plicatilis]
MTLFICYLLLMSDCHLITKDELLKMIPKKSDMIDVFKYVVGIEEIRQIAIVLKTLLGFELKF